MSTEYAKIETATTEEAEMIGAESESEVQRSGCRGRGYRRGGCGPRWGRRCGRSKAATENKHVTKNEILSTEKPMEGEHAENM
mmetsp:Transcript_25613/g.41270  ORF Transcript_25613/g.41270 Transcript_25613/m.41270 type:complete len:83 (+) Transcript_25613:165-413(+)|eukprot:CAMPEP_0203744098 /NCGR_PEP_ID=MMETSP0098-20131031/296_1 /ASSEMBLY_ACC=CAM_ASM_000208 /TAXON_ID=96639 /ORGANISM=" , Strain NY0313808BC1" /LENGTH=82 /DNA_ID=CAMNT_0050631537 /DNA_START=70 /DNA_END=318 /DNA_ORIENTATION=-